MDDKILKELNNTAVYERLKKIRRIYEKLEKKQIKFCDEFCIHCEEGCGMCCEHFTPDITEVEAEFLAYGLIKENKADLVLELLKSKDISDHYCPLYIKESNHHCSVYKWRPLICRLFGATASEDKDGNPTFRKCKWNSLGRDITKEEFNKNKKAVIIMSDYGGAVNDIAPDYIDKELLPTALPKAIDKIRYLLELEEMSKNS